MWGLADIHAGNVIDVLPQVDRGNKSPFEFRHNKKPNVDHLHLKVFGCPCQYSPMEGPEHKRASKSEWGYYVGMQWPMCMVYNQEEKKVLSVSRKKIICHEGMYANFDPSKAEVPRALFTEIDPTQTIEKDEYPEEDEKQDEAIEGVHSIKVIREAKMNQSMNQALPPPPLNIMADSASQQGNQGENISEQNVLQHPSPVPPTPFSLCPPPFSLDMPFCLLRIRKSHRIAEKRPSGNRTHRLLPRRGGS
jgi:hypothetical protein